MNIEELYKIIEERKKNLPENSYVTALFKKGKDKIIQKVGEESTEVIIAAKNESKQRIISEIADLAFHLLVMMSFIGITPKDIFKELGRRKSKVVNTS